MGQILDRGASHIPIRRGRHRQVCEIRADAGDGAKVDAPLIKECYANFECQLYDGSQVGKHSLFIWEVVKANVATSPKYPETVHYRGEGVFMISGRNIGRRRQFKAL